MPIDFRFIDKSARPLYRGIADELARQIRCGELEPGERLLTQDELSKLLGIARNTVCRAYQLLNERCLVSTEVGRGTFVRPTRRARPAELDALRFDGDAINLAVDCGWVRGWRGSDEVILRLVASLDARSRADDRGSMEPSGIAAAGAAWLRRSQIDLLADRIVVCAGHHHALLVSILATTNVGDRIAADRLCPPLLRRIVDLLGRQLVPVELDRRGTDPRSLELVCRKQRPSLVYLMPHLHCATGLSIDSGRRDELVRVLRSQRIPFLEDDGLQLLAESSWEPLSGRCPEQGIYVTGFSRLVTREPQLEFLAVPRGMRSRLDEVSWATLSSPVELSARVGSEMIASGLADEGVDRIRETVRRRLRQASRTVDLSSLSARLSPHLWIEARDGRNGEEIVSRARSAGVQILPASAFLDESTPSRQEPGYQICLLGPRTSDELQWGLDRLQRALELSLPAVAN